MNNLLIPNKVEVNTVWLSNSTPKCLPQRNTHTCAQGDMCQNVYNSIVWKSKKFEDNINDHEQKNR